MRIRACGFVDDKTMPVDQPCQLRPFSTANSIPKKASPRFGETSIYRGYFLTKHSGPKVIHQVPEGSIVPSADCNDGPLFFSFPSISSFIIPRQSLCGNLISLVPPPPPPQPSNHSSSLLPPSQSYRILGYPICLTSPTYPRNEFLFNFCLVLSATDPDFNAYKSIVTKLAHLMLSLEEQSHFLSRDNSPQNTGKLYSLCETLISDLNNYCECMIPLDCYNTLNLKLFPTYAPPPPVKSWQVPLFTVRPESLMDENWDLTMQRIVPHINGVSSVKHIALLADADLGLTKQCIKHLLYYGCLLLLDIFSFTAIYAATAEFATSIASDEKMQRECARYVNIAFAPTTSTVDKLDHVVGTIDNDNVNINQPNNVPVTGEDIWPLTASGKQVDGVGIVELYAALKQGQSVREWYTLNADMLANIDLRRFVTFGVIKGFVYRVHKYAFAADHGTVTGKGSKGGMKAVNRREGDGTAIEGSSTVPALSTQKKEMTTAAAAAAAAIPMRSMSRSSQVHQHDNAGVAEEEDHSGTTATISTNPLIKHSQGRKQHQQEGQGRSRRSKELSSSENASPSSEVDDNTTTTTTATAKTNKIPNPNTNPNSTSNLPARLSRYLDGSHCFDQICTELEISEAELEEMLRRRTRSRWNTPGSEYQYYSDTKNANSKKGIVGRREGEGKGMGEVVIIHR